MSHQPNVKPSVPDSVVCLWLKTSPISSMLLHFFSQSASPWSSSFISLDGKNTKALRIVPHLLIKAVLLWPFFTVYYLICLISWNWFTTIKGCWAHYFSFYFYEYYNPFVKPPVAEVVSWLSEGSAFGKACNEENTCLLWDHLLALWYIFFDVKCVINKMYYYYYYYYY